MEFDTETITKCAFLDQFRRDNEIYSRIEIHTLKDGLLNIRNRAFVSRTEGLIGNEISVNSVPKWSELAQEMTFSGIDKLPFGYFKVPLGNNQDSESPLGASVFSRAVEHIQEADRRYSQINWEYESKETAVHIAQSLLGRNQSTGEPVYPAGKKRLYRAVEYNTGVVDKPFMDTFSPDIRDTSYFNGWNHLMRMIEFDCNLAYGTISDPNNTDKTAEEIKASKQRSYSFVQSCQTALQHALEDLVDAIAFWCDLYHLCPSGTYQTSFDWDDSIVTDVESERQSDRLDVSMGAMRYKILWKAVKEDELEELYRIKVIWAKYKDGYLMEQDERCGKEMPMFIAEDIERRFPIAVDHDEKGRAENWNYRIMIPCMFAMLKNEHEKVKDLQSELDSVKAELEELKQLIEQHISTEV